MTWPATLALAHIQPLATGRHRFVFQHPGDDDLLIKVMRPQAVQARQRGARRFRRGGRYTGFVRELKEYVALRARTDAGDLPVARVGGIVETDLGLGLLVEKIRASDRQLAPTLERLGREQGFTPALETALAVLVDRLIEFDIVLGDLHAGNIVHRDHGSDQACFVLIDGFGEKNIVPLRSMSRRVSRYNTLRLHRKLCRDMIRDYRRTAESG
ncbi:MAG TPA: YrbL family protein [Rhodanobacteraceae bacterium]|nr:YrbL family protein [Rhodanobacteraceae bacterium]